MLYLKDLDLAKRYGVTRQAIWGWARERPGFPQPVKLSERCTRWVLAEVEAYDAACLAAR